MSISPVCLGSKVCPRRCQHFHVGHEWALGTSNPSVGGSAGACRSACAELDASAVSGIRIGSSREDLGRTGSLILSILNIFLLATNAKPFTRSLFFFLTFWWHSILSLPDDTTTALLGLFNWVSS